MLLFKNACESPWIIIVIKMHQRRPLASAAHRTKGKNGKLKGLGISMLVCPAVQWSSRPGCVGREGAQSSARPAPSAPLLEGQVGGVPWVGEDERWRGGGTPTAGAW